MTLNPLPKSFLVVIVLLMSLSTGFTQQVNSLGIFTGITVPYTFDAGINKDARYRIKYDVKFAPVGIHYGVDYDGYGVMIDPCLIKVGQSFNVINIYGGEVGERNIDLSYFYFPAGFKLHIIDLSFFKVSFVASVGFGVLLNGQETITHNKGLLRLTFPTEVVGIFPSAENDAFEAANPGYDVQYDGVQVPVKNNLKLISKENFQSFQVFGGLGFRSDWDITETWRVSFDLRGNIGALEPRKKEYVDKVKNWEAIYDIYGARRDLFLSLNIGVARTLEIEPKDKEAKIRKRQASKMHKPTKYPWPKPRNQKSKN
jgi:hypothetical protein